MRLMVFNIKNNYWIKNYDGKNFPIVLANFITENNVDIICTQEMTIHYQEKLQIHLSNYTCNGEGRLSEKSILKNYLNELNSVISKYPVLNSCTYWLSKTPQQKGSKSYFSIFPRIVTFSGMKIENEDFLVGSLHLDHLLPYARKKQLQVLYKLLTEKQKTKNVILAGDFNMLKSHPDFTEFQKKLETLGINYLYCDTPTFGSILPRKLDHVFLSQNLDVKNIQTVDIEGSDHKALILDISKK